MKILSILLGLLLVLAFFGLGRTQVGLSIGFFPRWDNATPGELMTWVGYLGLLIPAGCLIGHGASDRIVSAGRTLAAKLGEVSKRERILMGIALTILLACLYRVLRAVVLLDLPITDEEFSFQFAGQILAGGQLMIEKPEWWDAAPHLFMYERAGMITSMDWPATIFAWAFSEFTRTGPWVFMVMAALPAAAVFAVLHDRHNLVWAAVGCVVLVCAPMFLMLSMTTHTHVGSRAFISIAIFCAWFARRKDSRFMVAFGLAATIALMFRPIETTAWLLPVTVWYLLCADDRNELLRRSGLALAGALVPALLFFAYNHGVTGTLAPPRWSPNELAAAANSHFKPHFGFFEEPTLLWQRFGANLSYNLLMLTIFVGGPIVMLAAFLGSRRDGFAWALTSSIFFALGIALFHDDYGIHAVGPIHYSEACVPVVLLAIDGLSHFSKTVRFGSVSGPRVVVPMLLGCVLTTGVFTAWHSVALYQQAAANDWAYSTFDGLPEGAVVLAPQLSAFRQANPEYRRVGGWVFEFRRPHPYGEDDVLILKFKGEFEPLADLGERPVFVAEPLETEPWIRLTQVR